jgi:hypothetical protein
MNKLSGLRYQIKHEAEVLYRGGRMGTLDGEVDFGCVGSG